MVTMVRVVKWCRRDERMCVDGNVDSVDGNVDSVDGDSNKEQHGMVRCGAVVECVVVQYSTAQNSTV